MNLKTIILFSCMALLFTSCSMFGGGGGASSDGSDSGFFSKAKGFFSSKPNKDDNLITGRRKPIENPGVTSSSQMKDSPYEVIPGYGAIPKAGMGQRTATMNEPLLGGMGASGMGGGSPYGDMGGGSMYGGGMPSFDSGPSAQAESAYQMGGSSPSYSGGGSFNSMGGGSNSFGGGEKISMPNSKDSGVAGAAGGVADYYKDVYNGDRSPNPFMIYSEKK